MTETLATFLYLEMSTIIPYMGSKRPSTDVEMTYLEKKNTDKAIHQKVSKKDVHETDMQNIYNLIFGHTNK